MITWPAKSPAEVEDFLFDFTEALDDGETLATRTVTANGATKDSDAIVDVGSDSSAAVQVWLSGGSANTLATITCTVTTSGGRTFSETAVLPIGIEPVTLAEAKAQVNMADDDSQDTFLTSLLAAARALVERNTRFFWVAASREDTFEKWGDAHGCVRFGWSHHHRGGQYLEIYRRPIASIESVTYTDTTGEDATYDAFLAPLGTFPLRIYPAIDNSFPALGRGGRITVAYTSGALDAASEEYLIGKRAMLLLIGHWFENRESVITGVRAAAVDVPQTVNDLLDALRPISAY